MPETYKNIKAVKAASRTTWRKWLEKNGTKEQSVWLIMFRKGSGKKSVYYNEAVEEALCFGWIDSKANTRDEESFYQLFAKRKKSSKWSRLNKQRVSKLVEQGLMMPEGLAVIELAKKNGTWTALDSIENLEVPEDLQSALSKNKKAAQHFEAFPRSAKRALLEWIQSAKTEVTRKKRIADTATQAAKNVRANQYRPKE